MIVYFYPAAMTPGCTTQACDFTDSLDSLRAQGFEVLGISPDKPEKLAKFRDRDGLTITLLSDPDKSVMTSYGAFGEKKLYGKVVAGRHPLHVRRRPRGPESSWRSTTSRPPATSPSCAGTSGWTPETDPRVAEVVELADTRHLGCRAFGRGGSSPPFGTRP